MSKPKAIVIREQLDGIPEGALLQASGRYPNGGTFTDCWIRRVPEDLGGDSSVWEVLLYGTARNLTTSDLITLPATLLYMPEPTPTPEEVEAAERYPRHQGGVLMQQGFVAGARWERTRQNRAATVDAQAPL